MTETIYHEVGIVRPVTLQYVRFNDFDQWYDDQIFITAQFTNSYAKQSVDNLQCIQFEGSET